MGSKLLPLGTIFAKNCSQKSDFLKLGPFWHRIRAPRPPKTVPDHIFNDFGRIWDRFCIDVGPIWGRFGTEFSGITRNKFINKINLLIWVRGYVIYISYIDYIIYINYVKVQVGQGISFLGLASEHTNLP